MKRIALIALTATLILAGAGFANAQEKEFEMNGYLQTQIGVFTPLLSQGFQDYNNEAYIKGDPANGPCDPVYNPDSCYAKDHGNKAGQLSMLRNVAQLMAEWRPAEKVLLHAVVRMVGSLKLDADMYAQPPSFPENVDRRAYARDWVWRKYYNEVELREFYLDLEATEWLSFRLGRQQVVWGDINSYRLLDIVNPENTTWHFGPLESFEDTRVPMWMVKGMIEIKSIEHSLEFLWVPMIDDPEDTVNVPLTFVGAWGLPISDKPTSYVIDKKTFKWPGGNWSDQRVGFRWRGNISDHSTYALVYYYTHQLSPPVPQYFDVDNDPTLAMERAARGDSSSHMKELVLNFPRQHITGFSVDYAFDSPIGMVAKLESSIELDRHMPRKAKTRYANPLQYIDKHTGHPMQRVYLNPPSYPAVNYAIQLIRPTMIRFLNPTQNFIMVAQFSHSFLPTMPQAETKEIVAIPGYNNYRVTRHSFTGVFLLATSYLHGLIAPRVTFAYVHPYSGFIATQVSLRLGRHWRLRLQVTDFFGRDPYKAVGLFRDRDEVNLAVRYQF